MNNIFLLFKVIKCNDTHCCDQKHLELINKFYSDIVCSLLQPSKDVLGSFCHHRSFHPIPGWNDSVKLAHIKARTSYLSCVKKAWPKNGEILTRMKSTQKQFKYELRRYKRLKDQKSADVLAKVFHSDTSSKAFCTVKKHQRKSCKILQTSKTPTAMIKELAAVFLTVWQNIKKLKKSCPLPAAVRGASGSQKIAEMWKNHFSNLLNSVENDEYKEFVYNNITWKNSYMNLSQYMCDVNTI